MLKLKKFLNEKSNTENNKGFKIPQTSERQQLGIDMAQEIEDKRKRQAKADWKATVDRIQR